METVEALQWLRKNNLYESCQKYSGILKKIFTPCLNITDEQVLILGDTGVNGREISPILSGGYFLAAKEFNIPAKLVLQNVKSKEEDVDEDAISSLRDLSEKNVVFLNMSNKFGKMGELGKSFRKYVKKRKHRFVSSMSLSDIKNEEIDLIINAIDVNYKPMQGEHQVIKDAIDKTKEITVKTLSGTELYVDVAGMETLKSDGNYVLPETGGNLPAGQIFVPPKGRGVNGKVVVDGSSKNKDGTMLIKKPIKLTIEDGSIVEIDGGEEAKKLDESLEYAEGMARQPGNVRRVGEFGIGLNPNASVTGAMIVDNKARGTAHIGIGSNYWFGGSIYSIIHFDQVFKNPKIYLDDKELKF